ncbi:PAS domain S-box protein [Kamptonema formosum]|uniref:PAS domain S-box protein n=1 Tax=Kamptonema formosum TaxID=331992 RepID=UPI0018E1EAF1|nr:PAS domain S-box protein [Oscillatoria sp. PCC 10802]
MPLRLVVVVPFVIQICGAVGIVGWLCLHNGQKAVNSVASDLRAEITARIQLQLQSFLATPHLINQINASAIRLGQLNLENLRDWERHFWQQIQLFDSVTYISLGTQTGEYTGIERLSRGTLRILVTDSSTKGDGYFYATDSKGNRTQVVHINRNYDSRKRPWYTAAARAGKPVWSEIYPVFDEQQLTITAGLPVYDKTQTLRGVLTADIVLSNIGEFLRGLKIGETGQTFIVERSGLLVAASSPEELFTTRDGVMQRIKASESGDSLIRATAHHLEKLTNNYSKIESICQAPCHISTTFQIDGKRQFVQLTPLRQTSNKIPQSPNPGTPNPQLQTLPDWLIVVVVPEADFMDEIEASTRTTIVLCGAALLVAILLGVLTSRWIVQPIHRLNAAAIALSRGDWNQTVPVDREDELGVLAETFNKMTRQLRLIYAKLQENLRDLLGAQESLQLNEAKYRQLVENANSIIMRLDTEGRITFFNEFAQNFFSYASEEILGYSPIGTIVASTDASGTDRQEILKKLLQSPEDYRNSEFENIRRNGEAVWVAWTTKALRDAQGNLTGILCIGTDISARKRAEDELHKERRYLAALVEVQRRLLASKDDGNCFAEILEPLGQASGASRVYFFENHQGEGGQLLASQRAEWCAPGVPPEIDNPLLQNFPLENLLPRWHETLSSGQPIAGTVSEFPLDERQILELQGVLSILILPLIVDGEFFGFLGFDSCREERGWEVSEVNLLRAAAAAVELHQERNRAQEALQKANQELEMRVKRRTAQLGESEARFRQLSGATFEGIVVHEEGRILDCNQAFARMFGCEGGDLTGTNLADYIVAGNRFFVSQKLLSTRENPYESVGLRKDGSTFPIEIQAKVMPYKDKQVRVVALRDITERKQAEEALRESEEKFSKAFRQSPDAITITTISDGLMIDVSEGFESITGYSRQEVIGRTTQEMNLWVRQLDRTRLVQLLGEEGTVRNLETQFRKKSGEVIEGLLSAEIIYLGGRECILTVTSDITELRQAQETLARALEEQESIFEAQLDIIFVFDLNFRLVKWNKQMEQVTGLPPAQLKGRSAFDFFAEGERENIALKIQQTFEHPGEDSRWAEAKLIARDGVLLDYQFTGVPLRDHKGDAIGFTGAGRDITESKRAAEILRAERERSDRLLLNILPEPIAERLKREQGSIADSFEEVTVLFADIVGFTELSASISPTELVELLNQIFSRFDRLAEKHGLEKIKTIGDAYMVVGGLPVHRHDHAEAVADMALDMQREVASFSAETGCKVSIRTGINSGPVVAGVIGLKKFIYDLWGDAVNTASRMESHGIPGAIQVTAATCQLLRDKYICEERGIIQVKGKGEMLTYLLKGKKSD